MFDEDEARALLLEAFGRCLVLHGDTNVSMSEVAAEAGVTRATLYRYFPSRRDLVLALVVQRFDRALERLLGRLRHQDDPAVCLPELVLGLLALTDRDALNQALHAEASIGELRDLGLSSEQIIETAERRLGPLLTAWQQAGRMHADLPLREVVRYLNAQLILLESPAWQRRSKADKRQWVADFLVRTLVPAR